MKAQGGVPSASMTSESLAIHFCARCRIKYYEGQSHECDLGPVIFRRDEMLDAGQRAIYRTTCPTCNLAVDLTTDVEMVRRYAVGPIPALEGDALALWLLADAADNGPEKRAQNAAADMHEARLREEANHRLHRGGCRHVERFVPD